MAWTNTINSPNGDPNLLFSNQYMLSNNPGTYYLGAWPQDFDTYQKYIEKSKTDLKYYLNSPNYENDLKNAQNILDKYRNPKPETIFDPPPEGPDKVVEQLLDRVNKLSELVLKELIEIEKLASKIK